MAEVLALEVAELTPRLVQASVRWRSADAEGRAVYEFDASYTLARLEQSTGITALAHNELSRLRDAIDRL